MFILGIDLGTSSVKVAVIDAETQQTILTTQYPETESPIISHQVGWAEQSPENWWNDVKMAIQKANDTGLYHPKDIVAIGIAYQMHGLVLMDKDGAVLRDSIIWCDSRAVPYGERAYEAIGKEKCLSHLLNSPGNFTAAKLAWVKENEPAIFERIDKVLLPGDFIGYRLTGNMTTTPSALSEGIFWDFQQHNLSKEVLEFYGFSENFFPVIQDVFSEHGTLTEMVANELGLTKGIPVAYKAGDQPNNALSLNVLNEGDFAATAGTSGVIYGVSNKLIFDDQTRINSFAHVNHAKDHIRTGVLLCINGAGISNRYIKQMMGANLSYSEMNEQASKVPIGSDGLHMLPFGNGAERIFNNKIVGAHCNNVDLNKHTNSHFFRATQEGVACAFKYGFDIMQSTGMQPAKIKAGKTNMFLSPLFCEAFSNLIQVPIELYDTDGSVGAAKGAGIGAQIYTNAEQACSMQKPIVTIEPNNKLTYQMLYQNWEHTLQKQLADI